MTTLNSVNVFSPAPQSPTSSPKSPFRKLSKPDLNDTSIKTAVFKPISSDPSHFPTYDSPIKPLEFSPSPSSTPLNSKHLSYETPSPRGYSSTRPLESPGSERNPLSPSPSHSAFHSPSPSHSSLSHSVPMNRVNSAPNISDTSNFSSFANSKIPKTPKNLNSTFFHIDTSPIIRPTKPVPSFEILQDLTLLNPNRTPLNLPTTQGLFDVQEVNSPLEKSSPEIVAKTGGSLPSLDLNSLDSCLAHVQAEKQEELPENPLDQTVSDPLTLMQKFQAAPPENQIGLTLFYSDPETPDNFGVNGTTQQYVEHWVDKFKCEKGFITEAINSVLKSHGVKKLKQKLGYAKAKEIGAGLTNYLKQRIVMSRLQISEKVNRSIWQLKEASSQNNNSLQKAALKEAFEDIHNYSPTSFVKVPDPNSSKTLSISIISISSFQLLAKYFAYNADEKIKLSLTIGGRQELVTYKVQQLTILLDFPWYGLTPESHSDAPPIILFKGTTPRYSAKGFSVGLVSNVDPLGPGYIFFKLAGLSKIKKWIENNVKNGKKCLSVGHSLGGAFASYSRIYLPHYIEIAHTFNSPLISYFAAKEYQALQSDPQYAETVFNWRNDGDIITRLGHRTIGLQFLILTPTKPQSKPKELKGKVSKIIQSVKQTATQSINSHNEPSLVSSHSATILQHPVEKALSSLVQYVALPIFFIIGSIFIGLKVALEFISKSLRKIKVLVSGSNLPKAMNPVLSPV